MASTKRHWHCPGKGKLPPSPCPEPILLDQTTILLSLFLPKRIKPGPPQNTRTKQDLHVPYLLQFSHRRTFARKISSLVLPGSSMCNTHHTSKVPLSCLPLPQTYFGTYSVTVRFSCIVIIYYPITNGLIWITLLFRIIRE